MAKQKGTQCPSLSAEPGYVQWSWGALEWWTCIEHPQEIRIPALPKQPVHSLHLPVLVLVMVGALTHSCTLLPPAWATHLLSNLDPCQILPWRLFLSDSAWFHLCTNHFSSRDVVLHCGMCGDSEGVVPVPNEVLKHGWVFPEPSTARRNAWGTELCPIQRHYWLEAHSWRVCRIGSKALWIFLLVHILN